MMQLQNVRLSAECFPHYIINGSNTEMISLLMTQLANRISVVQVMPGILR